MTFINLLFSVAFVIVVKGKPQPTDYYPQQDSLNETDNIGSSFENITSDNTSNFYLSEKHRSTIGSATLNPLLNDLVDDRTDVEFDSATLKPITNDLLDEVHVEHDSATITPIYKALVDEGIDVEFGHSSFELDDEIEMASGNLPNLQKTEVHSQTQFLNLEDPPGNVMASDDAAEDKPVAVRPGMSGAGGPRVASVDVPLVPSAGGPGMTSVDVPLVPSADGPGMTSVDVPVDPSAGGPGMTSVGVLPVDSSAGGPEMTSVGVLPVDPSAGGPGMASVDVPVNPTVIVPVVPSVEVPVVPSVDTHQNDTAPPDISSGLLTCEGEFARGTESGKCYFPFHYKGRKYCTCASLEILFIKTKWWSWCPTTVTEESGRIEAWDYCTNTLTVEGDKCTFPFIFKGVEHNECVNKWCATSVSYDRAVTTWAFCAPAGMER